jgi:hypothetical protein
MKMADATQSHIIVRGEPFANGDTISRSDRTVLKTLAQRVAELAHRPIEQTKRDLWVRLSALEPTRPIIFCDPDYGWNEIISEHDLLCEGVLARNWEYRLRKEIWWGECMKDDHVVEPFFRIAHVYTESDWGMHEEKIGGLHGGAFTWTAPLKFRSDFARLHFPIIEVDWEASRRVLNLANDVFGDVLPAQQRTSWLWTLGLTSTLVNLRGLEQIMYDMVDEPELLHELMAFLRDGTLAKIDFLEKNGLLGLNNDGFYMGSGGYGWSRELPQPDFDGHVRPMDMWGFAESQETVGVSPAMFEEFVFQYQLPILERFGLNWYGCCEPLDARWHLVKQIPRLRRVAMSPWVNLPKMAEVLGPRYVFSRKPAPADLAMSRFDEDRIRRQLREEMRILRQNDCRAEFVMTDNHTIARDPQRVIRWVQIAREEAER